MKKALALIICAAMLMPLAGCSSKPKQPRANGPVKIALVVWPGYGIAFLAQEKGIFKKNGVEVELLPQSGNIESLRLFKQGRVDGFFSLFPDIILLGAQGVPAKVVTVVDVSQLGDVIIARPEIKSLADLKDRTVSFEGVNTFSQLFVIKMLEKAGLDEADLKFANVKSQDVLGALKAGTIDAGHVWEPAKTRALKEGYKVLAQASDIPDIIIDVLTFSGEVIANRPDDVRAIVRSLFEAGEYLKQDPEGSIRIMAAKMGISEEEMRRGIDGIYKPDRGAVAQMMKDAPAGSLFSAGKIVTDFYLERGQISAIPTVADILDPRFVEGPEVR